MTTSTKNFAPIPLGNIQHRSGFKQIPWERRGLWKRLKIWWYGNPIAVNQLLEYGGKLYAATDKGLYWKDGDVMRPVLIMNNNAG